MKCKNNNCDNETTGRQVFCSDRCRKALSRTETAVSRTNNSDNTNSDREVGQPDIKATAVSVPGDRDYQGVCSKADGEWQVN